MGRLLRLPLQGTGIRTDRIAIPGLQRLCSCFVMCHMQRADLGRVGAAVLDRGHLQGCIGEQLLGQGLADAGLQTPGPGRGHSLSLEGRGGSE